MLDKRVYWVHLQRCIGECAVLEGFIEKYGSAETFYNLGPDEWKNCGIKGIARKANEKLNSENFEKSEDVKQKGLTVLRVYRIIHRLSSYFALRRGGERG